MEQVPHEPETELTFIPSRVEWMVEVKSVTVRPDRLELESADGIQEIRFREIGRLQESRMVRFLKKLGGMRPAAVMVAERNWFQSPQDRYFLFYTSPPLTICMPSDDALVYVESVFFRVQGIIRLGGYATFDLG